MSAELGQPAAFDCRISQLPNRELVCDYFRWRAADALRNALNRYYFRIFNPFSQSKRFDPEGTFIKKLCPELEAIPKAALHDPAKLSAAIIIFGVKYPEFVVNYNVGRERALKAFKEL